MHTSTEKIIYNLNKNIGRKNDITHLGMFLAKERDERALKILNYLLFAIQTKELDKKIDVNRWKPKYRMNDGIELSTRETIPSRLIENPLIEAGHVFDFLAKTEQIDYNFKPYNYYSLKEIIANQILEKQNSKGLLSLTTLEYLLQNNAIRRNSTIDYALKKALENNISEDMRHTIQEILNRKRNPKIDYITLIADNKSQIRRNITEERQKYLLTQEELIYYKNNISPRLERKEIRIK